MIKKELINKVADDLNLPKAEVNRVFCAIINETLSEILNGGEVRIRNFATFTSKIKRSKKAYDFKKKRIIEISERRVPVVKFCKDFKVLDN